MKGADTMPLFIQQVFSRRAVALLMCLVCLAGLTGCRARTATPSGVQTSTSPTPLPPVKADNRVVADGRVVPVRSTDLSLASGGIVTEILVNEGDSVVPGQLLLRLNAARQNASVAQAAAEVRRAVAKLEEVKAGSRAQEIASAQAGVDAAQARLDALKQGPRPEEIAAAEASLAAAQAALRKAQTGATQEEIIAARADLANAEAARRQAQAAYDQVAGSPNIGSLPQALQLEQATNNYNAAKARYDNLLKGPNPAEIASARAQVDRAQAELDALKAPVRAADLAEAEAEVRRAQAQLDLVLAGPQPEQLAAAEADVAAAEAALAQARAALADMELRAPFTGTVAMIDVSLGQQVTPGFAAIRLADFSSWLIETNDLTELKVVGLAEGNLATIAFDAIPDLLLPGHVSRIRFIGENKQGDITYTVVVQPDRSDERLRWNMTAKVTIEPGTSGASIARVSPTGAPPVATPDIATPVVFPLTSTSTAQPSVTAEAVVPLPSGDTPTPLPPTTPTPASPTPLSPAKVTVQAPVSSPPTRTPVPRTTARPAPPRPTATPILSNPALLDPPQNDTRSGEIVFRWQPTGPLPDGAAYEVVWWAVDEDPVTARGISTPTTNTSVSVNLNVMHSAGQFRRPELYWTVLIVRTSPYVRLTQPAQVTARLLFYALPSPPLAPTPTPVPPRAGG